MRIVRGAKGEQQLVAALPRRLRHETRLRDERRRQCEVESRVDNGDGLGGRAQQAGGGGQHQRRRRGGHRARQVQHAAVRVERENERAGAVRTVQVARGKGRHAARGRHVELLANGRDVARLREGGGGAMRWKMRKRLIKK